MAISRHLPRLHKQVLFEIITPNSKQVQLVNDRGKEKDRDDLIQRSMIDYRFY